MDNPNDSPTHQQPEGNNNPQKAANENSYTQFTNETTPRPRLVPSSFSTPVRAQAAGSSSGGKGLKKKKKRGRSLSYDGDERPKRKFDMGLPAICAVCKRKFPSHFSLFGHLRTHNKREWRGAFPPPNWVDKEKIQQVIKNKVIPTLLDVAQETLEKMQQEKSISAANDPSKKVEFDLNVVPQEDSCSHQEKVETNMFDLNFSPPKEDNDDGPTL